MPIQAKSLGPRPLLVADEKQVESSKAVQATSAQQRCVGVSWALCIWPSPCLSLPALLLEQPEDPCEAATHLHLFLLAEILLCRP